MSMSLENVFGPNGLSYNPSVRNEVRVYKFPDGGVRAFRHLSSEWALYDFYLTLRRPGLHEALLTDIYDLSVKIHSRGDHLSLEQRIQMMARKVFIELPLVKVLKQPWPANESRHEQYRRKVV